MNPQASTAVLKIRNGLGLKRRKCPRPVSVATRKGGLKGSLQ